MISVGERLSALALIVCVAVILISSSLSGSGFQHDASRAVTKAKRIATGAVHSIERGAGGALSEIGEKISSLD